MFRRGLLICCCLLFVSNIQSQVDSTKIKMSFDLGITRGKNIYLWPIIRKTVEPYGKDLQIAFTLFQNKRNFIDTLHHSHLLPLFWHDSSVKRKDTRFLTIGYPTVYRTHIDFKKQIHSYKFLELAPEISLIEFAKSKDGSYLKNSLLFFLWYKQDQLTKRTHFVAFPLYWYFNSPEKKSNTFFPLYSFGSYHYKQYKYLAITPLFWHFNYNQYGSTTALYPFFYYKKIHSNTDSFKRTVLFPLYFAYNNHYYKQRVLFPVYWSYQYGVDYTRTLFPIIWATQKNNYKTFTFFPLASVGHSTDYTRSHILITPLIGQVKKEWKTSNWVFPFYVKTNEIRKKYQYAKDKNKVFLFDTINKSYIFPWYVSEVNLSTGKIKRDFFPFYWRRKESSRDNYVVFPLLWSYNTYYSKAFAFMPFYAKGRSKSNYYNYFAITPLYWHKNIHYKTDSGYSNVLFPIWWQKKLWNNKDGYSGYNVVFPLWWHFKDSSMERNSKVLFPFVWSLKSYKYKTFAIMPFFSKGQATDSSKKHLAITPLYWQFKESNNVNRYLFPIWYYSKNYYKTSNTLFPIWWSRTESNRKARVLFPLYWSYDNHLKSMYASHKRVLFPLYWKTTTNKDTNTVIFPLSFSYKNNIRKTYTFFPIYLSSYNHKEKVTIRAITPLAWHYKSPLKTVTTFFPIVLYKNKKIDTFEHKTTLVFPLYFRDNNTYANIKQTGITPFIWHYRSERKTSTTLFPIYFYSKLTIDSNIYQSRILFPIYFRRNTPNQKNTVLFPLVYSFKNNYYNSFTFFPLISTGKSLYNTNRHFAFTPLFWNVHHNHKHTVTLVPLFSYSKDQNERKNFHILYFLYNQSATPTEKRISFLWPLCEYEKDRTAKTFRFAPLLWYKKTANLQYNAVLPFYYYRKTESAKQFNLLWQLYAHQKDTNGLRKNSFLFKTLIVNKYPNHGYEYRFLYKVYSHVKKEGKKEVSIFPFYYQQSDSASGSSSKSYCLALYSKFKRPIPNTIYFYEEEKILWFIRLRSNYKSLKARGIIKEKP